MGAGPAAPDQGHRRPRILVVLLAFRLGKPAPGSHAIRSRAFDEHGTMQPTPEDPSLASRHTYWENNGQITRTVLIP